MNEGVVDQPVELRQYLAIIKSRKWAILAVTAVILSGTLAYSYRQTPRYSTEARVLVKPLPTSPNETYLLPPNLETEGQLVASQPVAALVRRDLGLALSPDALLPDLDVESVVESEVLVIRYTATDPALARDAADSFATNYIQYRRDQALDALLGAQGAIRSRVRRVTDQLSDVITKIEAARTDGSRALVTTLQTQRSTLIARLGVLQQRLDDLQPDRTVRLGGGEVIEQASLPTAPSFPDHTKNGVLALTVGLLLGIGVAFLRERLDDRFKERIEVARAVGAPILGTVPRFRFVKGQSQSYELSVVADSKGPASEAYKSLRTGVEFISKGRSMASMLVTSPSAGEGKTVTVGNLGMAMGQAGSRVVLVSADLRRPTLDRYFSIDSGEPGLSNWLLGEEDLWGMLKQTVSPNVLVLPSGPIPHNPAELLASPRLGELIAKLEQDSDMVLLDSPPCLPVADAAIIASRVPCALLVIDASSTRRSAVVHAKEALDRVGTNVIGCLVNAFDPSTTSYAHYDAYYYSRYESERPEGENVAALRRKPPGAPDRSRFSFRR